MRRSLVAAVLGVVVLVPTMGSAQVYFQPTPPPQVTAGNADWQIRGEPVFYAGNFYWPTGPTVFFDGSVMVRSGVYQGVPLYADTSLTPYSVVYVPIGGKVVRPYERRRAGEIAGSVGSVEPIVIPESDRAPRAVGTSGRSSPTAAREAMPAEQTRPRASAVQSIPRPRSNSGVWLQFNGTRWYSAGDAISYSADRFVPIGEHRGFPVYRDASGKTDKIYVASVKDGPLAPYKR